MKKNPAIDALTKGLKDGGFDQAYNFPGSKSHVIFSDLNGEQISINERVALESAYGASLAGKRSVVACKGVGLNVASDVFLHIVLNGLNAGIVLILSDDVEAQSSPERQDSRSYFEIFGGLWLEPMSIKQAYDFGSKALDWSEKFDVPVVIRLTNQFFDLNGGHKSGSKRVNKRKPEKNREKYISYWKVRNDHLKKKNKQIQEFVETLYKFEDMESPSEEGIICVGSCQRELEKYEEADILTLFTYPLPKKVIKEFSKNKKELTILEQGNDYACKQISGMLGNMSMHSDTGDEIDKSEDWIIWNTYEKLFNSLKKINPSFVVGDEGSFTDETTKTIEVCLCMGASVGITMGMAESGIDYPFCVIGDTSFQFAGKQTLEEAVHRGSCFGVILLDNGGAQTTGGQSIVGDIYNVSDVERVIVKYNETSEKDFENILKKMRDSRKLTILYVQM